MAHGSCIIVGFRFRGPKVGGAVGAPGAPGFGDGTRLSARDTAQRAPQAEVVLGKGIGPAERAHRQVL